MNCRWVLPLAFGPLSCLLSADSFGPTFAGYTVAPVFENRVNSPGLPLIPVSYGGISLNPANSNQLIVGGTAEGSGAAFYSIGVSRDGAGHILGLTGSPVLVAAAPKLAAGAVFGPSFNSGEVFFYSIASGSGGVDVGMIRWGGTGPGRTVNLVPETPGGLNFVPLGMNGFGIDGGLKILTINGKFYSASYTGEPTGTYDFPEVKLRATLPVPDVQGFTYVRGGAPGFPVDTLLVAEYRAGAIAAYDVDSKGDPLPATRRTFFTGPPFARPEGLFVDPETGDLLISTHSSSTSGIYRISGFTRPPSTPITSCGSIVAPGFYHLTGELKAPLYGGCLKIESSSNVHLDCRGYTVQAWGIPIEIDNVNGFSVRNCKLVLDAPPGTYLFAVNSRNGLFSGNTIEEQIPPSEYTFPPYGLVRFWKAQGINVVNNRSHVVLHLPENTNSYVRYNRCTAPRDYACIIIGEGTSNTIDSNDVDSAGTGVLDPGIRDYGDEGAVISNNSVHNAGVGIEMSGAKGSRVNANSVRVAYNAFTAESTINVTWSNNQVASSRTATGPNAGVAFVGTGLQQDRFFRNVLADVENRSRFSLSPPGNNVFTQNDFGHTVLAPDFSAGGPPAPGVVVDGGGNQCAAPLGSYPLSCH
jgi:hypothetical protein